MDELKNARKRTETHACDSISRHAAYAFGNDEFNLEAAYHDCKLVFDRITDDDSFQKADTGLILYYANEIIYALQKALEGKDTNDRGEQPEPISDAYMKAVLTWLIDYQIKAAELKGRYTPYEVLSWVVSDWRKEYERSGQNDE